MKKTEPRYYAELNYFNATGCLLVILIHVLSLGITSLKPLSWEMALVFLPWKFSGFVVPAFLFCGAVKVGLAAEDTKPGYRDYILERIRNIYLPYVVANIVYYLSFIFIDQVYDPSLEELLGHIFRGDLTAPFYYIVLVMQFYLLYPLWIFIVKKIPWYIAVPCGLLLMILFGRAWAMLPFKGIEFSYFDRLFPSYLGYLVMGLYVGKHYESIREKLQKQRGGILLTILYCTFVGLSYLGFSRGWNTFNLPELKLSADILAIILLLWICIRLDCSAGHIRLKSILTGIHRASFFVYLYHCLFLALAMELFIETGIDNIMQLILLRIIVCYTMPFFAYILYKRIRKCSSKLSPFL